MSTMFLTPDEVQELTGYKYPSKQIQWLQREGFAFRVAADGKPRLLREAVIKALGGKCSVKEKRTEPNWDAI